MRWIVACLLLAGCSAAPSEDRLPAFFDCLRETDAVLVSAHRAGPGPELPENSIAALDNTLAAGPAMVELDVRATSDGVLVLLHDATLDRTTTGSGAIAKTAYAALADVRLRDPDGRVTGHSIPTLNDALTAANGKGLVLLDIKPALTEAVVAAVARADAFDDVVFIAYRLQDAVAIQRAAKGRAMISLTLRSASDLHATEQALGGLSHVVAWTGTGEATPMLYEAFGEQGVEIAHGTFGTADRQHGLEAIAAYQALRRQGVDVIATNEPLAVSEAIPPDGVTACLNR